MLLYWAIFGYCLFFKGAKNYSGQASALDTQNMPASSTVHAFHGYHS
jgi:hypothetical protein